MGLSSGYAFWSIVIYGLSVLGIVVCSIGIHDYQSYTRLVFGAHVEAYQVYNISDLSVGQVRADPVFALESYLQGWNVSTYVCPGKCQFLETHQVPVCVVTSHQTTPGRRAEVAEVDKPVCHLRDEDQLNYMILGLVLCILTMILFTIAMVRDLCCYLEE